MTSELVKGVKSAGVPKLADGKTVASRYAARLAGYRDAYVTAAAGFDRANPRDGAVRHDRPTDEHRVGG